MILAEAGAVHLLAAGSGRPVLLADMRPERRHPVNASRCAPALRASIDRMPPFRCWLVKQTRTDCERDPLQFRRGGSGAGEGRKSSLKTEL